MNLLDHEKYSKTYAEIEGDYYKVINVRTHAEYIVATILLVDKICEDMDIDGE